MTKLSDYPDEVLAELARLLRAGKLNVRVNGGGRIIPDNDDFEEVRVKRWRARRKAKG